MTLETKLGRSKTDAGKIQNLELSCPPIDDPRRTYGAVDLNSRKSMAKINHYSMRISAIYLSMENQLGSMISGHL